MYPPPIPHESYNHPLLLTAEEIKDPLLVLKAFYEDYHLSELRQTLWQMGETCLTTDNHYYNKPTDRADLIQRVKDLEKILEAASILITQNNISCENTHYRSTDAND